MSMSISSRDIRDKIYGNKKKRNPCPSEAVAEAIDKGILRECLNEAAEVVKRHREEAAEVYTDTTTKPKVEAYDPCCVEEECTPVPQEESRTLRMKVPRAVSRFMSDSPCGDSSNARGTLEDWDTHGIRLAGRIYDDIRGQYPNGEMIYTETVKSDVSELKEGAVIRTRNNYYLLGKRHVPNDE